VAALISHRFPFDKAQDAYDLILGNTAPHLGVVLRYEGTAETAAPPVFPAPRPAARCVMGVIGAGAFARAVLLPVLARRKDVELRTIVTQRGLSAEHAKRQFGFAACATEIGAVLDDPAVNAVLVETPLALSREELGRIADAREGSSGFLLVGFNRRFAPMSREAAAHLARRKGPKCLLLRVNAGALPAESWINAAAEGGGRILGELCHFVDLARFLAAAPIVSVQADAAAAAQGACDDLTVTLRFAEGSLATIAYTALGDSAFSKERVEAFAGGSVVTIDNFLA